MLTESNMDFRWIGRMRENQSNEKYYGAFKLNGETYRIEDVVLIKTSFGKQKLGKLLCLYETSQKECMGSVQWFTKAVDLPRVFTADIEFDAENEVVEDLRNIDTEISLRNIITHCSLVLALPDEPTDIISQMKLDKTIHFSCRYRIKKNKLLPLIQALNTTELIKLSKTECTPTKRKNENQENHFEDRNLMDRIKSPRNPNKSLKLTPNRVKRNLNESFDYSPCLNYSIEETEEPLKIKLRLSMNQPQVLLDKLDDDYLNDLIEIPKKLKKVVLESDDEISIANDVNNVENIKKNLRRRPSPAKLNVRRSSRNNGRKSYVDFQSPEKLTPRKTRLQSYEGDFVATPKKEVILTPVKEKVLTPSRKSRHEISTPSMTPGIKIENSTPSTRNKTKNRNDVSSTDMKHEFLTPTKRNRSKSKVDESPVKKSKVNEVSTPLKKRSTTPEINEVSTPSTRSGSKNQTLKNEISKELRPKRASVKGIKSTDDENYGIEEIPQIEAATKLGLKVTMKTPRKQKHTTIPDFDEDEMIKDTIDEGETVKNANAWVKSTPRKASKTPMKTPAKTPRSRLKMIREGEITPSMHARKAARIDAGTPLSQAREKLHVSHVPKDLPCRQAEFTNVQYFLQTKLSDGCGGCMYISGVPGTGKTTIVNDVIKTLQKQTNRGELPKFDFVSINGMRLTEPRQSYVEILRQLTGKTIAWEQAQSILEDRFTKPSKKQKPVVLLVDELDIICTKRQDVVYNLLDWPSKKSTQLIVIAIANTMDLPERLLMGRVTSRLGLTRLTFQAYTHKQLQEIVARRLMGTGVFNPDAIQLVARKVASVSGDARRALDICRRAAEVAERESGDTEVSMSHVNEALNSMTAQPKVLAIKHCSRLEQLVLQAIVAEIERTGVEETTFADMFRMLASVAGIDGFRNTSPSLALRAIAKLGNCRLLLTEQKPYDQTQKLLLNVSSDDIYYALRQD